MYQKNKPLNLQEKRKLKIKTLEKEKPNPEATSNKESKKLIKISTVQKREEKDDEIQELRENILIKVHRLRKEFFLKVDLINTQETGLNEENKKLLKEKILEQTLETTDKLSYEIRDVPLMIGIYESYKKSIEKLIQTQRKAHLKVV